ncbi:MAG: glycosyl hydrolase 115 family protein [Bacteroidota bacterium]
MKNKIIPYSLFLFIVFLFNHCTDSRDQWILVQQDKTATVFLPETSSGPVRLAVEDLVNDVQKITGKGITITQNPEEISGSAIIVANMQNQDERDLVSQINPELDSLAGKWEAYAVYREQSYKNIEKPLLMVGSDERGTMFAIYHFIEKYLQVDPFYYWSGMEPEKREELVFDEIEIIRGEPDFKYRGWFMNDEDLITEFVNGAGERDIDYRYYGQVVHPEVISRIFESLIRSRYNLTIPASFVDIMNPPERRLVEEAAKRGLFISQHHVEPVGVSAFTFSNYWKERGREPKYSFFSSRKEIEEVWEKYIAEWSKFPNVVWQVGLRGIADSPMWLTDSNIPRSDSARGELISEAMKVQSGLIQKYDDRSNPPMTSTLWAEGVTLHQAGHLSFPENTTLVFADNNPGYIWLDDFYETEREPGKNYGVYYHHQLWGSGPHLVQGVAPAKTYEMFQTAYDYNSNQYALLNVSNVREFILGIEASAEMLYDLDGFNPDTWLQQWCSEKFAPAGDLAYRAYRNLFESYQVAPETETPFTLDGQLKSFGSSQLYEVQHLIRNPGAFWPDWQEIKSPHEWWHTEKYIFPARFMKHKKVGAGVERQLEILEKSLPLIPEIKQQLQGDTLHFFIMNYEAQFNIILGLTRWCNHATKASFALQDGNKEEGFSHIQQAAEALELAQNGQELASRGKWEHWYRGDKKFNLNAVMELTAETLERMNK